MNKIRLGIYIRDMDAFLTNRLTFCFDVYDVDSEYTERWTKNLIKITEVWIDTDEIDTTEVMNAAVASMDSEIETIKQSALDKITELEDKKQQLLALPQL